MLAIQLILTTSNMLNAGCLMPKCFIPLSLLGKSSPQAYGPALTALQTHMKKILSVLTAGFQNKDTPP